MLVVLYIGLQCNSSPLAYIRPLLLLTLCDFSSSRLLIFQAETVDVFEQHEQALMSLFQFQ